MEDGGKKYKLYISLKAVGCQLTLNQCLGVSPCNEALIQ